MAGVPINFAVPSESAIASYNSVELLTGQGKLEFNGYNLLQFGGTKKYSMSEYNSASTDVYTDISSGVGLTFKTSKLKKPLVIEGDLNVTFSLYICRATTGAGTPYVDYTATFSKISNGVTTVLSTGPTQQFTGSGIWTSAPIAVTGPVTHLLSIPKTNFQIGDEMVLTITGVLSGVNPRSGLFHDPLGRKSLYNLTFATEQDSKLKITVPIKIEQ
jgi:hypothetical protein